jgi:RNA polymerase sigma-70 factor, ECF subfamily
MRGAELQLFRTWRVLASKDDPPVQLAGVRPDSREFAAFMRAYQDMVFSTALRLTGSTAQAEDISQDVFLKAYEHFEQLRASPSAGGWLKTVATRLTLNHLARYRKRWRLFSEVFADETREDELDAVAASFDAVLQQLDGQERHALLERALQQLPDHQRVPLVLFHFEEMSYRDIARHLGHSLSKIKTDILRGRLALARSLAQGGLAPANGRNRTPS